MKLMMLDCDDRVVGDEGDEDDGEGDIGGCSG